MRWKDLAVEYLRRKQGGRCSRCGAGLYHGYQMRVRYREGIDGDAEGETDLDLLTLVHDRCEVEAIKKSELQALQAYYLVKRRGLTPAEIARGLRVSERTVWRGLKKAKSRVETDRQKSI
jgi:DNA-directed RNA polymerase specialized sigma24 family protein